MFDLSGKVAVVTGGGGVLGGSIATSLIEAGVKVAILDIRKENVDAKVEELKQKGGEAYGIVSSVLDMDELKSAKDLLIEKWGKVDILINTAGGNLPGATLTEEQTVFDMKIEDYQKVTDLNLNGTVFPSLVFGEVMANQGEGSIITISSMATYSAITRVLGYSVAKNRN